jgi:hypothetical protein
MKKKKRKKPKTIGQMTNSRGTWAIKPVTQVVQDKTKYKRTKKDWGDEE